MVAVQSRLNDTNEYCKQKEQVLHTEIAFSYHPLSFLTTFFRLLFSVYSLLSLITSTLLLVLIHLLITIPISVILLSYIFRNHLTYPSFSSFTSSILPSRLPSPLLSLISISRLRYGTISLTHSPPFPLLFSSQFLSSPLSILLFFSVTQHFLSSLSFFLSPSASNCYYIRSFWRPFGSRNS